MSDILGVFSIDKEVKDVGSLGNSNKVKVVVSYFRNRGQGNYMLNINNAKEEGISCEFFPMDALNYLVHTCSRRTDKQDLLAFDEIEKIIPKIVLDFNKRFPERCINKNELENAIFKN